MNSVQQFWRRFVKVLSKKTKIFAFAKFHQNMCWMNFSLIVTNYEKWPRDCLDGLETTKYKEPSIVSFEELKNVKICL